MNSPETLMGSSDGDDGHPATTSVGNPPFRRSSSLGSTPPTRSPPIRRSFRRRSPPTLVSTSTVQRDVVAEPVACFPEPKPVSGSCFYLGESPLVEDTTSKNNNNNNNSNNRSAINDSSVFLEERKHSKQLMSPETLHVIREV